MTVLSRVIPSRPSSLQALAITEGPISFPQEHTVTYFRWLNIKRLFLSFLLLLKSIPWVAPLKTSLYFTEIVSLNNSLWNVQCWGWGCLRAQCGQQGQADPTGRLHGPPHHPPHPARRKPPREHSAEPTGLSESARNRTPYLIQITKAVLYCTRPASRTLTT